MPMTTALLLALLMPVTARGAECPLPPPHLEGELTFRGDTWPIRLQLPAQLATADSVTALMDIPELLMSGRPVTMRCTAGAVLVDLPFGLGGAELRGDESADLWSGWSMRGSDTLRLALRPGSAPPYDIEDVVFDSDGITLAGRLYLPHDAASRAGVVVVHGSGPQGLHMLTYRSWGDFHARRGLATLIYDKRGVGASGGDFRADSAFTLLTADALAALRYLAGRAEVDSTRVGLAGHSQAGWIATQAAARSPSVAFLALLAAPTGSVAEQELQRVRYGMQAAGLGDAAIRAAVAHTRLLFAVAAAPEGWDALARSSAAVEKEPWADWVHRPAAPANLRWWRTHFDIDAGSYLRALRIPIYAAYSAQDPVVPALRNAGVLRELSATGDSARIVVVTVKEGDHRLELPAGRRDDGSWHLPRVHPEYVRSLDEWVRNVLRF